MQAILDNLTVAMQGITENLGVLAGVKSDLGALGDSLAATLREVAATLTKLADELDPPEDAPT